MKEPLPAMVCAIAGFLLLFRPASGFAAEDACLSLGTPISTNNLILLPLSGESAVTYYIESSTDLRNWTRVLTNSDQAIARTLVAALPGQPTFYRASRGPLPLFDAALTISATIDCKGNGIYVDSYDSSDPNYSTGGMYDVNKRGAGGDVASATGPVNIQGADIYGHLRIGPNATYSIGNGVVGDLPANWPAQSGIESGWLALDYRFCIPDVEPPYGSGSPLPPPKAGTSEIFLGSESYFIAGDLLLQNGYLILIDGSNPTLYVTGSFLMNSGAQIVITNGGSFKLYVGSVIGSATSCNLSLVSSAGSETTFQFYGLPTTSSLTWSGNAQFVGSVYAPQAAFLLGGGGNYPLDYQGAIIASSLSINGHFNFHFDSYLKHSGPTR
jgi:hypothetical protein